MGFWAVLKTGTIWENIDLWDESSEMNALSPGLFGFRYDSVEENNALASIWKLFLAAGECFDSSQSICFVAELLLWEISQWW